VGWSGDSKFVISGSGDGQICVWDLSPIGGLEKLEGPNVVPGVNPRCITLDPIVNLQSGGVEGVPSRCVRFNPRLGMLASGGEDLVSQSLARYGVSGANHRHSGYPRRTKMH